MSVFFTLNTILSSTLNSVKEKIDISAYLDDPVQSEDILDYTYKFTNKTSSEITYTPQVEVGDLVKFGEISELGQAKIEEETIIWPKTVLKGKETQEYKISVKIKFYKDWPSQIAASKGETGQDIFESNLAGEPIKNFGITDSVTIFNKSTSKDVANLMNSKSNLEKLKKALSQNEQVLEIKFVSKAEALSSSKSSLAQIREVSESLEEISNDTNPVPASLEIKPKDSAQTDKIIELLKSEEHKALISDPETNISQVRHKNTVDKLLSFTTNFRKIGLILTSVLIVILVLITFNTLRLAIFSRKEEVEIMKLVGASQWFIRGPFMAESVIYGFFGSMLAVLVTAPALMSSSEWLRKYLGDYSGDVITYFTQNIYLIILGQLLVGIFLALISTTIALKRYLKY